MDKEWEELWKALREMERVDEQMRERLRQREPVLWFQQKEEQKEDASG